MIGSTIGHFRIEEKLGEGGMGVVYKAQDTRLNRIVALKLLPDRINKDETAKARFLQEAQAAAGLNHPSICTIYGVDDDQGQLFMSMEYVDGGTLRESISKEPLPISTAIGLGIQIGEALQEAHSKGIVHRDVKADNIMLTSKGLVKVMDFGLAKLKGALKLTRTSSTVGTLGYMAPEQIQGGEVDPRSDIFSFGVLLFEMLTGKLPFRGEHEPAMMYSILNEQPDPIRKHLPDISVTCERILEKALDKNPEERYQSAADVVADLKRWKRETGNVSRPTAGIVTTAPTKEFPISSTPSSPSIAIRFPRYKRVAAIGGIVILLVAAVVWLRPWATGSATGKRSLAVLPFENQAEPEREYFADGISEEITTRLSSLSGIGVIARSSAWQYKGTKKSIKEIGAELGVDYVLMGTVRWSRNESQQLNVRVSPALIDVNTGIQVWANTFDAAFQNAFALQSDIAQQVARALDVSLLTPEASALEQQLTSNAEAYDYFLQGNEYENRSPSKADGDIAIEQYERAIALDPDFAAAYARLSISHARSYWFYFDRTQERVTKARVAAEKALKLAPDLSVTHEAMGWLHYHTALNYDAAIKEFNGALQLQPNNPTVSYGLAAVYRRKGDLDESLHHWRKAIAGDPRSSELVRQLGETLGLLRRYEEADAQYAAAIRLAPDNVSTYGERAKNVILWKGDVRAAETILDEGMKYGRIDSGEDLALPYMKYLVALMVQDYAKASTALALMDPRQGQASQFVFYPRPLLSAQLESDRGSGLPARALFQEAVDLLQRRLREHPEDERAHSSLGIAYAGLGRNVEAVREGLKGVELLPVEQEAWRGSFRLRDLAEIYAMTGDHDKANDVLDRLLRMPSELSGHWLRLDPRWKPLRDTRRFDALIKEHS